MNFVTPQRLQRLLLTLATLQTAACYAAEDEIRLKDGVGRDTVVANCIMCHSLDYIPMNSPFMKKANWQATVNKMVKVMGAPIGQDEAAMIVEYLAKYYGTE